MTTVDVRLPPKLIPVFETRGLRYRGAYGGRGSGKTRAFAKMAVVEAFRRSQAGEHGVVLCAREFMNSLDESSMAEVKHAIDDMPWARPYFEVGEKFIRTTDRRIDFKFAGLRHNLDSIKSKARILICWVDEAEPVSKTAWDKLLPTVREDGSEVWVTWNPEVEGSATDTLFRKHPPPDSMIIEVNWEDNPWFPDALRRQMEWDQSRDPDKYAHIWLGGYLQHTEARVFKNWTVQEFNTPDDVERLYFGGDWGYSIDPSVLVRCWTEGRRLFIDQEAYEVGCPIDRTPALFAGDCPFERGDPRYWTNPEGHPGVPGAHDWPITADSARPETIRHMRDRGFDITGAKKGAGSVEDGVEFLRSFDIVVHPRCRHTIDELSSYQWKTDPRTGDILPQLADRDNHVIDALRYALESRRTADRRQRRKSLAIDGGKAENWAGV